MELEHYDAKHTGEAGTGTEVARYIASMPGRFKETHIICHSLNFSGRNRMLGILREAGLRPHDRPWGWLTVEIHHVGQRHPGS